MFIRPRQFWLRTLRSVQVCGRDGSGLSSALIFSSVNRLAWVGQLICADAAALLLELDWSSFIFSSEKFCAPSCSSKDEQLPAMGCCSIASRMVGLFSTARRKRNHVVSGMRRAACGGRSARSRMIRPKPPLSRSRSVARRTCSRRWSDAFDFFPSKLNAVCSKIPTSRAKGAREMSPPSF